MTYSYSFNEENFYGEFESIEEAIAEAKEYGDNSEVFIGENGEFHPSVDGEWCVDMLREQVADKCGEYSDNYLYEIPKGAEKELTDVLTEAFNKWAKKHGQEPNFYPVNNVKKYSLEV